MAKVTSQSLFTSNLAESRPWQSYVTSGAIHTGMILALFLITFPTIREMVRPPEHVVLVAPVIPQYKPKIIPRPVIRPHITPKVVVLPPVMPKPVVPPPVAVKMPEVRPQPVVKAPEIQQSVPVPQPLVAAKLAAPAPPKPEIHTGVFSSGELAKAERVPNQVKVGGFGDPNGAKPAPSQTSQMMMAKLGGFDQPQGDGQTGAGGHRNGASMRASGFDSPGDANGKPGGTGPRGSVRTGGFGDSSGVPNGTATHGGTVKTGGFNDGSAVSQPTRPSQAVTAPVATPVQVLFKPKPVYTAEARNMKLEGQVALQVVFGANGSVRVLQVVRGLGHGLDEAAQQAAAQVKFRPATKDGSPVDTNATIYITFELS